MQTGDGVFFPIAQVAGGIERDLVQRRAERGLRGEQGRKLGEAHCVETNVGEVQFLNTCPRQAVAKCVDVLVIENKARFSKKAVGRINFSCNQGEAVLNAIHAAKEANAPQQLWLHANGYDVAGEEVSSFSFLWTIKVKN